MWIYRRDDTEYAVTTFYPSHTTSSPGYRQSNATNHFPTNMATGYANPLGCTHNVVRRHIPFHYLLLQLKSFLSTSAAGRVEHIYAIRFFQGISESSTFVGTHYILGAYVSYLLLLAGLIITHAVVLSNDTGGTSPVNSVNVPESSLVPDS